MGWLSSIIIFRVDQYSISSKLPLWYWETKNKKEKLKLWNRLINKEIITETTLRTLEKCNNNRNNEIKLKITINRPKSISNNDMENVGGFIHNEYIRYIINRIKNNRIATKRGNNQIKYNF